MILGGKD